MAKNLKLFVLLCVMLFLISACTTTANNSSNSNSDVASAPDWKSYGSIVQTTANGILDIAENNLSIQTSGAEINIQPEWILYNLKGSTVTNITPQGVTTRGGISVSYVAKDTFWVDIGSYKGQVDGTFGVTSNGGRSWSLGALPSISEPTPNGFVAISSQVAYFLLGTSKNQSLFVTTNSGNSFNELISSSQFSSVLPKNCTAATVGYFNKNIYIGTSCKSSNNFLILKAIFNGNRTELIPISYNPKVKGDFSSESYLGDYTFANNVNAIDSSGTTNSLGTNNSIENSNSLVILGYDRTDSLIYNLSNLAVTTNNNSTTSNREGNTPLILSNYGIKPGNVLNFSIYNNLLGIESDSLGSLPLSIVEAEISGLNIGEFGNPLSGGSKLTSNLIYTSVIKLNTSLIQRVTSSNSPSSNVSKIFINSGILDTGNQSYLNIDSNNKLYLYEYSNNLGTWNRILLPLPTAPSIIANS